MFRKTFEDTAVKNVWTVEAQLEVLLNTLDTMLERGKCTSDDLASALDENTTSIEAPECKRCGSSIKKSLCTNIGCPFSSHIQLCEVGWIGHPEHRSVNERTRCSCED